MVEFAVVAVKLCSQAANAQIRGIIGWVNVEIVVILVLSQGYR